MLLHRRDVSLVTLTGPGGVGKTRIALAVAHSVRFRVQGTAFVDLSPLRDPERVLAAIAHSIGVREQPDRSFTDLVIAAFQARHLLLVLDSCERVVDAAPQLAHLLTACPSMQILATSRIPLHLSLEQEYPVEPLPVPDPDAADVARNPAVALFAQRARAVLPTFDVSEETAADVARICAHLDGLPLAIELAAARSKLLAPADLLSRLEQRLSILAGGARDLPGRQRTMRQAIAWSHDLLAPKEQALFRRLSVFVGGFTVEAAEAVAHDVCIDMLDGLGGLVEQNFLRLSAQRHTPPRFLILDTVREYGLERLVASSEEASTREAHAAYFLDLTESALPHWDGPGLPEWLHRIDSDHDNLIAALSWAADRGSIECLARTAGALWRYWMIRGRLIEARAWLERARTVHVDARRALPVEAQIGIIALALLQYDETASKAAADDLLAKSEATEDAYCAFWALVFLGEIAVGRNDAAQANAYAERALACAPATRTPEGYAAVALMSLSTVAARLGDQRGAVARLEEALRLFQSSGNVWGQAWTLAELGTAASRQGEHQTAATLLRQSLATRKELRDNPGILDALGRMAGVAAATGQATVAAWLVGAVDALRSTMGLGNPGIFAPSEITERAVAYAEAVLGADAAVDAVAAGRALPLAEAIALVDAVSGDDARITTDADRPAPENKYGLTPRELEVLRLIADGARDQDIAADLGISRRTVTTYATNIFNKLGLDSRTAAATHAVRHGLL